MAICALPPPGATCREAPPTVGPEQGRRLSVVRPFLARLLFLLPLLYIGFADPLAARPTSPTLPPAGTPDLARHLPRDVANPDLAGYPIDLLLSLGRVRSGSASADSVAVPLHAYFPPYAPNETALGPHPGCALTGIPGFAGRPRAPPVGRHPG